MSIFPRGKTGVPTNGRVIKCRMCGTAITVTPGLEEMAEHWRRAHPGGLRQLRFAAEVSTAGKLPNGNEDE